MTVEVETAFRRLFLDDATIRGYVRDGVYRYRLEERIQGTGGRALVLRPGSAWAAADPVKTSEFPTLEVEAYADPDRDAAGNMTAANAEAKAKALSRAVTNAMANLRIRGTWVGGIGSQRGLYVISCRPWRLPLTISASDEHGPAGPESLGETVKVRSVFAIEC